MPRFHLYFLVAFLVTSTVCFSQEQAQKSVAFSRHRITGIMAYDFIPAAEGIDTQTGLYVVPVWGLNYDYWLTPKFGIGLHNDMAIQQYEVRFEEKIITRSHPIKVCLTALYRPSKHWTFIAGAGREYERTTDFYVVTFGTEYGIEIDEKWEVNFNLVYVGKLGAYDSGLFGIGFSRKLGL